MTTTADATTGPVQRRRTAQRFLLSESWRRRLPLLPALIIMILLTQVPFVMSIYYSLTDWKVVPPGPARVRRARQLHSTCSTTSSSVDASG